MRIFTAPRSLATSPTTLFMEYQQGLMRKAQLASGAASARRVFFRDAWPGLESL